MQWTDFHVINDKGRNRGNKGPVSRRIFLSPDVFIAWKKTMVAKVISPENFLTMENTVVTKVISPENFLTMEKTVITKVISPENFFTIGKDSG